MAPRARAPRRHGWARLVGPAAGMAAGGLALTLLAGSPVAGAGPIPSLPIALPSLPLPPLPSLPLPPLPTIKPPPLPVLSLVPTLPPLPLPTLALPTLALPTLPVPSLPVPTLPVPSVPVPSLPLPSNPLPSSPIGSPGASAAAPPVSPVPGASGSAVEPGSSGNASPSAAAGGLPASLDGGPGDQGGSPFAFALPLLIAGIPIAIVILIVIAQVAGGAVWLPVIRRWLNRRLTPGA